MRLFKLLIIMLSGLILLTGCAKDEEQINPVSNDDSKVVVVENGNECHDLLAGQSTDAGDVCISVDSNDLLISYTTSGSWMLTELHLWVGMDLNSMPSNRSGSPIVGHFPYKAVLMNGMSTYTFRIPLVDLGMVDSTGCDSTLYFAAHAVVTDGYEVETAWADGYPINVKGNWSTYFFVEFTCDDDPGGGGGFDSCETAFAYSGANATCFIGADFDLDGYIDGFNRWGWTNIVEQPGIYTMDIYAGAGQCDISKGTYVGVLNLNYDGAVATLIFDMEDGFTMDETHLYIGNEPLPRDGNGNYTVAPGQYPYIHNLTNAELDTFTVSGLSDTVYVVAHAVVCGF